MSDENRTESKEVSEAEEEKQTESKEVSKAEEEREEKPKYPRGVYFILGHTYCDRFCYFGIQVILTLYVRQRFQYSENKATVVYHTFIVLSDFLPLVGAIIADSWLGRFWTIFYFLILYVSGAIMLSAASATVNLSSLKTVSLVALFIISIGAGGVKPCSQAFGGDQFEKHQTEQRGFFFSMLYFMTNCGCLMSMILTPILREKVHCFGQLSCYPLAFGLHATLITASFLMFVAGKLFYKILPPEGSTLAGIIACILHALYRKAHSKGEQREHWLEFADDKYSKETIKGIRDLMHVMSIFLPVPFFFTLFDQGNSKWVLQATKMRGETFGFYVQPDQLQVVNPLLIIVLIPLFEYVFYPLLTKFNLLTRSLQRMIAGCILAVLSFTVAGAVSLAIEASEPTMPEPGLAEVTVVNNSPCHISISGSKNAPLEKFTSRTLFNIQLKSNNSWNFAPSKCAAKQPKKFDPALSIAINSMMITLQSGKLEVQLTDDSKTRSEIGQPKIRMFYSMDNDRAGSFELRGVTNIPIKSANKTAVRHGITPYVTVLHGQYDVYSSYNATSYEHVGKVNVMSGGSYIVAVYKNSEENITNTFTTNMMNPDTVHIFLLVIQYFLLTAGEVMVAITGMQFSYSEAPGTMKTAALAGWSVASAMGNLIMVFIMEITSFKNQSSEFFLFAGLMSLDVVLFLIMAHYYVYLEK